MRKEPLKPFPFVLLQCQRGPKEDSSKEGGANAVRQKAQHPREVSPGEFSKTVFYVFCHDVNFFPVLCVVRTHWWWDVNGMCCSLGGFFYLDMRLLLAIAIFLWPRRIPIDFTSYTCILGTALGDSAVIRLSHFPQWTDIKKEAYRKSVPLTSCRPLFNYSCTVMADPGCE